MVTTGEKAEVADEDVEGAFMGTVASFGSSDTTPPDSDSSSTPPPCGGGPEEGALEEELTLLCAAEPAGEASTLPRGPVATEALVGGAEEEVEEVEEAEEEEGRVPATAASEGTEEEMGRGALECLFMLQGLTVGAARDRAWAGG